MFHSFPGLSNDVLSASFTPRKLYGNLFPSLPPPLLPSRPPSPPTEKMVRNLFIYPSTRGIRAVLSSREIQTFLYRLQSVALGAFHQINQAPASVSISMKLATLGDESSIQAHSFHLLPQTNNMFDSSLNFVPAPFYFIFHNRRNCLTGRYRAIGGRLDAMIIIIFGSLGWDRPRM